MPPAICCQNHVTQRAMLNFVAVAEDNDKTAGDKPLPYSESDHFYKTIKSVLI